MSKINGTSVAERYDEGIDFSDIEAKYASNVQGSFNALMRPGAFNQISCTI